MVRRFIDVSLALLILMLLSPLLVILAIWIKLDSPGPVFHRALRVGERGRPFFLVKFRTMVVDAAKLGPPVTVNNDHRVTRAGRFLRGTKLDEFPQFWNVLKGEMTLVGPRPEDPSFVARYTQEQREILKYRPGLTSPASLLYSDEASYLGSDWETVYEKEILCRKIDVDLAYLKTRSIWNDFVQLGYTVLRVFKLHNNDKERRETLSG
jgi:lipopolysaccharide/colanic/teichoic acid biosynthesis glycosyltransferase